MICRTCSRLIVWTAEVGVAKHLGSGRVTCGPDYPGHRATPDPEGHVEPQPAAVEQVRGAHATTVVLDEVAHLTPEDWDRIADATPVNQGDDGRWGDAIDTLPAGTPAPLDP